MLSGRRAARHLKPEISSGQVFRVLHQMRGTRRGPADAHGPRSRHLQSCRSITIGRF
jgi:hypothetical protein